MIDIHSHIIYGVDDGPAKKEESLKMIYEAEEAGVEVIIATPHLRNCPDNYQRVLENFNELKQQTSNDNIVLKLGREVQLSPSILDSLKHLPVCSLDDSRYLLIEMPFSHMPVYGNEAIFKLLLEGFVPIIAHPERNFSFINNRTLLYDLIDNGCLTQIDAGSIVGAYGDKSKNFARQLCMSNLVNFIASDAHDTYGYTDWYIKAYHNIVNWVGEERAEKLFNSNAEIILQDSAGVLCIHKEESKEDSIKLGIKG